MAIRQRGDCCSRLQSTTADCVWCLIWALLAQLPPEGAYGQWGCCPDIGANNGDASDAHTQALRGSACIAVSAHVRQHLSPARIVYHWSMS